MTAHDVARALPDLPTLRERCRVFAMTDAVLSPEWDYRYFSFNQHWAPDQQMASMRNGSGDEWSIVFSPAGAFLRGFDHEARMSPYGNDGKLWPGLVDTVPEALRFGVDEPAFSNSLGTLAATVCLWRETGDDHWHTGQVDLPDDDDPDGSAWLFELLLGGTAAVYQDFAEDYYEMPVDLDAVIEIFQQRPLTDGLVRRLNPEVALSDLAQDIAQIGYPAL
ncbi:hypothetical protein GCM10010435_29740 [Winogradskya consettensis]|uniref:Uncharacterized protein n=1 Tax=Winogradskya consettensis TaxID=113560 RepID=A0A919VVB0_9ACTN|nr:hypothetical protein [Actinoplanes consettensis]GIM70723.1 hypothetical protein Aco04nite_21760 [Actinoplanes consettensis]